MTKQQIVLDAIMDIYLYSVGGDQSPPQKTKKLDENKLSSLLLKIMEKAGMSVNDLIE